ncbi:MAG: TonB-dependent receptor [Prevotella sp.]|nr:TonB-dependent receptor [Prevotella sp.]
MIKRVFISFLTLVSVAAVDAATLKGVVLDNRTQEPIIGAAVLVKGSAATLGVTTNVDGRFELQVAEVPTDIEVTYVGYRKEEISVYDTSEDLVVYLRDNSQFLSEVVVVGYGTQKRENLTTSVSSVQGRSLSELPAPSFETALAGRASGVNITVPNGSVGQAPLVHVRGVSSITSGTEPLYVVDGVPIASDQYSSMATSNPLASLNVADIESVDVLKDASAAALYGSRAANGVVLITTRQGKRGKPQVSYQGTVSATSPTKFYDILDAEQYVSLKNEAVRNRYGTDEISLTTGYTSPYGNKAFNVIYDENGAPRSTDWQKYVTKTGWSNSHTVSVGGSTDAASYYISGNYLNQEGTEIGNTFDRVHLNANVSAKVNDWLSLSGKLTLTESNLTDYDTYNNRYYEGPGIGLYWASLNDAPNIPIYFDDGSIWHYNGQTGRGPNTTNIMMATPASIYESGSRTKQNNQHTLYNLAADFTPFKGFVFRTQYGRDVARVEDNVYYAPESGMDSYKGYAANVHTKVDQYTWTNTASYAFTLKKSHNFDLLAGIEAFEKKKTAHGGERYNQVDMDNDIYEAAYNNIASIGNVVSESSLLSYLFRVNYDYKSRYIFSFNFRRDGFSALSKDNRWGNFGGGSAAWRISDERFFKPWRKYADNVKLRVGWGVVGNTKISDYASSTTYSTVYNGNVAAYERSQEADSNLKWETSKKFDVGIIATLFKDIEVELAYYNINGSDLILNTPTSPSRGVPGNTITSNVGSMYNRGFEFSVFAPIISKKNFSWTTTLNLTTNKNEVTSLGNAESIVTTYNITQVGKSIGQLYLYRSGGVDPETGRRILYDTKGQEVLIMSEKDGTYFHRDGSVVSTSDLDRYAAGNTLPTYYGGWTNTLRYRDFDLSVDFQFSGGNKIWNGQRGRLAQYGFRNNLVAVLNDHWTEDNHNATFAKPIYNDNISNGNGGLPMDFLMEDGDFLRLKNLTLGYNLEKKPLLRKLKISGIRVYAQATNLFVLTGYSGLDPEVSASTSILQSGLDDSYLSQQTRTFTFGLNVKF